MERLAHQRGAEHLVQFRAAVAIAPGVVASFDWSIGELRAGAEARGAGATAGDGPRHPPRADRSVPDRPAVAAGQAALVLVLRLEVARGHVGIRPDGLV